MYRDILSKIKESGFEAYLVGGSVRDMLMGREVYDYDVCTSALPEQIKEIFKEYRVIETGIKHGTVTVAVNNTAFEITTFRGESGYSDHRHPDAVIFGATLEEDLKRRDFTMNAICYDGERIIDPLNGAADVYAKIIRAVGDPKKRFNEDALRILRALRFACVLGFEIEEMTACAMTESANDLQSVSAERIFAEFKKAAEGIYFKQVYEKYYELFKHFIPNAAPVPQVYLSMNDAVESLKKIKADNKSIRFAQAYFSESANDPIALLRKHGKETAIYVCGKKGISQPLEAILNNKTPYTVSMLDIDGTDIMPFVDDNRKIGTVLETLLDSVISGNTENNKTALLKKVVDIL